ncbi:Topoisomerase 1-associated factor 1 [Arachnomyces sp. PD_36]|nr:Topoisomerase 1-associated factor 1 [Arachnomyces sp. PD_36]
MDLADDAPEPVQVVDPEIRAYVYSLVTALGGFGGDDSGRYLLGDDALACLRDIKKWLKLYDEKTNRMDVARCLAEANLVNGDLIPILSLCSENAQGSKHKSRVALACLELLVPLTWPIEHHGQMTVNHHRHTPYLRQAQVLYKRGILGVDTNNILRSAIQIGLPSMAIERSERSGRDEGILKLILYLFRNMAMISPSPNLSVEGDDEEASVSATINAFHQQDVFALLLTMCSNMGDDFSFQDVVILEVLFHIVKGVSIEKLFMNDTQRSAKRTDELQDLLQKESGLQRENSKNAPTRHGRFGTMIWVKRDNDKVSTVSGQDVLMDNRTTLLKMDKTKKWNKPRRRKPDVDANDFNMTTHLTPSATKHLRTFVEEFLDSGFNPLFAHVRKAIEREAERVSYMHSRQFFYVVSWFLEAERVRRARQRESQKHNTSTSRELEPDSFALVASVLNQETFITLNRFMQHSFDHKEWQDLNSSMRCFTQILLTVQEMSQSPLEEDQEIAENIQNRIFYEETTHDRIVSILRGYKDQGFGYLDSCTDLSHVFLRMLEQYSKQNSDMQVRSRRRAKRKAKAKETANTENGEEDNDNDNDSEQEELAESARVSKERKFDFTRLAAKFCTQKCVDTFVALTTHYRDLNIEQLKRAHRFFYRVAFKQENSVILFRLDIISLFYKMIKGPEGLDSSKTIFREWEELVRQIIKRLVRKLDERPELFTELLFSKINSTTYYLEYGHEKQTLSSDSRPPAELEVNPQGATTTDGKLAIVVAALILDDKMELVDWVVQILKSASDERKAWEAESESRREPSAEGQPAPTPHASPIVVKPLDEKCRTAMFKNARLRLLMTLSDFERTGAEDVPGATWAIPSFVTSSMLDVTRESIFKHRADPPKDIDGYDPREQLRRKPTAESRDTYQGTLDVDFGSGSEGEELAADEVLFPANIRSKAAALNELKQKRRKRRKADGEKDPLDDETLEERRRVREANALARQRKIKSDLYIHASDEETDEEADVDFFAREEERRKEQAKRVHDALVTGVHPDEQIAKGKKRKSTEPEERDKPAGKKRLKNNISLISQDTDDEDTPMIGLESSPEDGHTPPTSAEDDLAFDELDSLPKNTSPGAANANAATGDSDDEDDDGPVKAPVPRRRGGFVIDSDSE